MTDAQDSILGWTGSFLDSQNFIFPCKNARKKYFFVTLHAKREKEMNPREEFDYIYRKYYRSLFVFAKRYLEEDDDCHDLIDDVFEHLWTHFDNVQKATVQPYLYTLLRTKCIDFLRHKKTEQKFIDYAQASSERYDSNEHIRELEERERKIKEVIDSLPPTTQEIFCLCFVEHKKYTEAAEELQVSVSTIKKHIVRALKLIREKRKM